MTERSRAEADSPEYPPRPTRTGPSCSPVDDGKAATTDPENRPEPDEDDGAARP